MSMSVSTAHQKHSATLASGMVKEFLRHVTATACGLRIEETAPEEKVAGCE